MEGKVDERRREEGVEKVGAESQGDVIHTRDGEQPCAGTLVHADNGNRADSKQNRNSVCVCAPGAQKKKKTLRAEGRMKGRIKDES